MKYRLHISGVLRIAASLACCAALMGCRHTPAPAPKTTHSVEAAPSAAGSPAPASSTAAFTIPNPDEFIDSIVVSANGLHVATAMPLTVRSARTGAVEAVGSKLPVAQAAFSPSGDTLAFVTANGTLEMLETTHWQPRPPTAIARGALGFIAFSPDGAILADASGDPKAETGTVEIRDAHAGRIIRSFASDGCPVSIAFAPHAKLLSVGSTYHSITLIDTTTWKQARKVLGFAGWITSQAFSPDGKMLAVGCLGDDDPRVVVCDTATWEPVFKFSAERRGIVAFSPDSRYFASGSNDGTATVWDAHTGLVKATFRHPGPITAVAFTVDGAYLLTGCEDHNLRFWSMPSR